MHQHCPLILFELTLHVSNYLVCGFVHLGLSNVHNMNFAHFTNYINNRWNGGVYMVQDFRCVHGTRHVETDLRPSVKGHSFSENSRVLTVEKKSDTQLVIFYLYSQGVNDIRNTTQIIQLPFLSLFVSSWSLAQPTDDLTRSVVAEQPLHISIPRWGGHFQSRQHTLYNM